MVPDIDWKSRDVAAVLEALEVDRDRGLRDEEVERRRAKHGENRLAEPRKTTLAERFLAQFKNVLICILLVAAIVSGVLGEITDAIVIAAIVVLNAIVGVVQESRAEGAIAALKRLSSPRAVVRRHGTTRKIESAAIVPGDMVILEAGRG